MPAASRLYISVNFSSRQLAAPGFVGNLLRVLDESGLDRELLNIEVTESVLLQTFGATARSVQDLRDEGMHLHIDDFGTGFSSLSYLHRLPVSAIKIDRSFLHGIDGDVEPTSVATIKAVIELAGSRQLKVIAEGIETPAQLAVLQRLGCPLGQGYYFARPLDVDAVERFLESRVSSVA